MGDEDKREPLLQRPEQADIHKGDNPSAPSGQPSTSGSIPAEHVVWEGTTWQGCPDFCFYCSPVCCSNWHWHITEQRIDLTHGCCGSNMETLDLRRIIDLHFHRSVWQMCCGRGTIVIHSDNDEFPKLNLTTFGTREVFERLKQAWTKARIATAVHHGDNGDHHLHV
ncbi:hypothetical protein ABBQ38_010188 [Trebouxia sp. C0009 RCD-2024]